MSQKPKISAIMTTYGHEKFIRQAIEGILVQECEFEVELIIANDCSPDRSDEIINDILENHPNKSWIKYFRHEKNLGSMSNFLFALKECKGEFIALCEGDDYWTDPLKLQKQIDFLDENPDYVACFHKIEILKTDGTIVKDFITNVPENHETLEALAEFGNYIHTPSVVFKNNIIELPFEFKLTPIGDYFLYIMLAEHGKFKFIEEVMAVYRHGVGILSADDSILKSKKWIDCLVLIISCCKNQEIKRILYKRYKISIEGLYRNTLKEKKESFFQTIRKKAKKIKNRIMLQILNSK
ncbi:glycosyltransferase family 2 protein [Flavobacterium sp. 2]|uniref:glycosyltransferase family 2 protein n=1 Tax=Flavobacterium sp. 2 TaxID=308053 RepID=UPI003CFA111A